MEDFKKLRKKHFKTLKQYVPIVARVHGQSHPEFYEVERIFNIISKKTGGFFYKKADLEDEFMELRQVSQDYALHEGASETYEAVYRMLHELDRGYFAKEK